MSDDDLLRRVNNMKFVDWVVDSALSKTILECQVNGDLTPDEAELAKLRAAILIGVTETMIKLQALVGLYLNEDGD